MPDIVILIHDNRCSINEIKIKLLLTKDPALIKLTQFQYWQVFFGVDRLDDLMFHLL